MSSIFMLISTFFLEMSFVCKHMLCHLLLFEVFKLRMWVASKFF